MADPYAELIDVGALAVQSAGLRREYALASFERLADRLQRAEGSADVDLHATHVGESVGLEGVLVAQPWLLCQRCLEPYRARIEASVRIAFVTDDDAAEQLPEDVEPVEMDSARVDLRVLVEDELLLALPLVPMHPTATECANAQVVTAEDVPVGSKNPTHRPFGDLREMLKR
jgi:uncharacterized protein